MTYFCKGIESQKVWNAFIEEHNSWAFFQAWQWGEVQTSFGRQIFRYGIYKEEELVGIFFTTKVVARRGTYLHVRQGPVAKNVDTHITKCVVSELKRIASAEHVDFIRMNPMIDDNPGNRQMMKDFGFIPSQLHAMDAELCWVLDITESEETLLSNMRKTTRYEIRRALQQHVEVRISTNTADLIHFRKLYDITATRHKFVKHDAIAEEFTEFVKSDQAILLLGEFNGEITTASIVFFWGDQAIYHHGASIPSKTGVSYAVQWKAICEAKRRGKKVYNFWGIAPENNNKHPWRGITLFKKGFGGRELKFIHAHDLPITWRYLFVRLLEYMRKVRKGY